MLSICQEFLRFIVESHNTACEERSKLPTILSCKFVRFGDIGIGVPSYRLLKLIRIWILVRIWWIPRVQCKTPWGPPGGEGGPGDRPGGWLKGRPGGGCGGPLNGGCGGPPNGGGPPLKGYPPKGGPLPT